MLVFKCYDESKNKIRAQCNSCQALIEIINVTDVKRSKEINSYHQVLEMPVKCTCGVFYTCLEFNISSTSNTLSGTNPIDISNIDRNILSERRASKDKDIVSKEELIKCPRCGSRQIHANQKGFGSKRAILGALVLWNPAGLLTGLIGSKKIKITCLKCGKYWSP